MTYVVFILVLIVVLLGYMLYSQSQAGKKQVAEQQQLLADYQRRVDEQQKLLGDYRALEKNFDNVGEGYEQALLAFDKMNEEQEKVRKANEALQQTVASLQETNSHMQESIRKKAEVMAQVISDLQVLAQGDSKLSALVGKVTDLDDVQDNMPPIEHTDNVMVTLIMLLQKDYQ